jgi:hypothetical protein
MPRSIDFDRVFSHWDETDCLEKRAFVIDDGVTEIMKWSNPSEPRLFEENVFSLSADEQNLDKITFDSPDHITFLISWLSTSVLHAIKLIVKASRCRSVLVLTSSSSEAVQDLDATSVKKRLSSSLRRYNEDDPYDFIRAFLSPVEVTISYFPIHAFPILSGEDPNQNSYRTAEVRNILAHCNVLFRSESISSVPKHCVSCT